MVRTLSSSRSLKKGQRTVLLPGATEAEPWEVWTVGGETHCQQACRTPAENRLGGTAILALPVAQVFCLPLWLNETDTKLFRGIVGLQLEARGLQPRGQDPIFTWSIVAQENARTLVLVAVLPVTLPQELEAENYQAFDAAARFFPLAPDALTLWREQDRLVVAVTRGSELAYFQALSEPGLTPRALQDLTCLCAALQMQEVIGEIRQLVLWTEATPAEVAGLGGAFGLPVQQATRPLPRLPAELWNLTPIRVDQAKRTRVARRWQFRGIILLLVALALAGAALGARLFMTSLEVARLQRWNTEHASALEQVHDTEAAWKDLRPALDEDSYPLELLLHVANLVPTDQLHLTLFETDADHVLIKAEAKNLMAAFQLLDLLKKDPHFKAYTWEMAPPHSLANDVTQLQIEGTHAAND